MGLKIAQLSGNQCTEKDGSAGEIKQINSEGVKREVLLIRTCPIKLSGKLISFLTLVV